MKLQSLFAPLPKTAFGIVLGTAVLCGCAGRHGRHQLPPLEVPDAPAALNVPPGQVLTLAAKATGVQIYECGLDKNDDTRFTWNFKAPEAELFNTRDKKIGKHYAGPTWEANDGSKVVGQVKASDDGPDATAVSWLLLDAKSNSGSGLFTHTASIQRLHTAGGKTPATGCDRAHAGAEARVPYTAQYYFYNGKP